MKMILIENGNNKNERYFVQSNDIEETLTKMIEAVIDITGCEEDDIIVTAYPEGYEIFNQAVKETLYISEIKEMQII